MRVSKLFGETLRDVPAEEQIVSQQLLVRAGYVDKLASGIFSYLPLGWRSLRKIEQILREEIDAIGGQELNMPVVHPAEIWQRTGRWDEIDDSMVRFKDRRGHDMALAMTHEEVVGQLAATAIRSYRQLPILIYQIQTKFRDEARARGGLIRVREFVMKDSYSLDADEEGLKKQYARHYHAYHRIGLRVGLPLVAVGSDVGMMGGKQAHEFMYLTPIGEDTLVISESGDYASNQEAAVFKKTPFDGGGARADVRSRDTGHDYDCRASCLLKYFNQSNRKSGLSGGLDGREQAGPVRSGSHPWRHGGQPHQAAKPRRRPSASARSNRGDTGNRRRAWIWIGNWH